MDLSAVAQTKPISTLSAYSYIPPRRREARETTYFNSESKTSDVLVYDRLFKWAEGWDSRQHRDDRKHSNGRGLHVYEEEKSRVVPLLSSSEYGRRPVPERYQSEKQFVRVAHVQKEFFRKNGITQDVADGYGSVVPI
ncbi:cilia- and flagella-associated protein 90 [Lampris incognitus]|uniref:cilia- and flagella-associated protein 90 n=1 Tax=Lampris incognitus TaxID=2546036 RepID=UPI0024B4C05C|nr:cilia- and flagella-associated protein 90 [Lampris incognitus]